MSKKLITDVSDVSKLNLEMFKIGEVLEVMRPTQRIYRNIVKDTNKKNGEAKFTYTDIYKEKSITFSTKANGNVFFHPDTIEIEDDSIIALTSAELWPYEFTENIALYLVTVLKTCCKGRYTGETYTIETILNWEVPLPARRFAIEGKRTRPVVDYQVMDAFIENIKQKDKNICALDKLRGSYPFRYEKGRHDRFY